MVRSPISPSTSMSDARGPAVLRALSRRRHSHHGCLPAARRGSGLCPRSVERLQEAFGQFLVQGSPDEAQTEQDLIFRVLEAVGWNRDVWLVQPRAARTGRSDVPDMLLFPDSGAKANALGEVEKEKRFRYGVAIVENKRWDRPLDRAAKGARKGDDRAGGPVQSDAPLPVARRDPLRAAHPVGHPHQRPAVAALLPGRQVAPGRVSGDRPVAPGRRSRRSPIC